MSERTEAALLASPPRTSGDLWRLACVAWTTTHLELRTRWHAHRYVKTQQAANRHMRVMNAHRAQARALLAMVQAEPGGESDRG